MVTDETAKCGPYACDGANKTFAITFTFHAAAHIEVRIKHKTTGAVTELTQPTDFSVDNANVVTVEAYSADYKLYILRATPQTQGTDLHSKGPFPAEETERTLDRLTLEVQELTEKLTRAALFGPASDESSHAFPEPENEYVLCWQDGVLANTTVFGGASYSIQAFMAAFLESLNKAAARDNLEIDAENTPIDDAGERFTATEVENALQELAGAGRTVETVKQNQDDIDSAESVIAALIEDLYNKHKADGDHKDNSIQEQHVDWGAGANQVGAVDVPIADAGGRITATEIENALQELAGVGRTVETIKQNHDDLAGRAARGVVWESTVTYAQNDIVSYGGTLYKSLQDNNLNKQPDTEPAWWEECGGGGGGEALAVGCVMMFDGAAWVDNDTMAGWYACIPENAGQGCPNMVDRFVMGKIVAGGGATGGSNTMIDHTHSCGNQSASHSHTISSGAGSHRHTGVEWQYNAGTASRSPRDVLQKTNTDSYISNSPSYSDVYANRTGSHHNRIRTELATLPAMGTGNQSASHTHSIGSGSAPGSTDNRPAYYSMIFIRKCA